jgi:hypothetical protein
MSLKNKQKKHSIIGSKHTAIFQEWLDFTFGWSCRLFFYIPALWANIKHFMNNQNRLFTNFMMQRRAQTLISS